ncbi:hypothetical protein TREMEDRAFT_61762 [Tremella mesenterica DSM 1558]|uniref:uncharacterized protein n=1 Tax=Tremella mesenterica (strain ATCC 24925 / CBS 8224 / DSM 1558 / NBRC 9311 / NRRL Y-6157 / RJB 2259-6 / UBC 559-6) TaxID=578456 RepID=UPI0003F4A1AE|nr:uncharacterized protein TREMEDRAFT_61762 [Tremella mesenterica DSM 1558]EIW69998.1 hypothetical protein TREMEDRAFT_61762 [Tremella mesenterica DSM 1558]
MSNKPNFTNAEWNLLAWMATEGYPQGQLNATLGLMGNTVNPQDLGNLPLPTSNMVANNLTTEWPPVPPIVPPPNITVPNETLRNDTPATSLEPTLTGNEEWEKWLDDEGLDEILQQLEGNPSDGSSETSGASVIAQAGSLASDVSDGYMGDVDNSAHSPSPAMSNTTRIHDEKSLAITKYGVIRAAKCINCSSVKGKRPDCKQFKRYTPCLRCTKMGKVCNLIYEGMGKHPMEVRRNPKRKARAGPSSPDVQYLGTAQMAFTMDPGPSTQPPFLSSMIPDRSPDHSPLGYVPTFPSYHAPTVMQMSEHLAFLHQWNQAATAHEDHARLTRWQMIAQVQNMIDDAKKGKGKGKEREDEEDDE